MSIARETVDQRHVVMGGRWRKSGYTGHVPQYCQFDAAAIANAVTHGTATIRSCDSSSTQMTTTPTLPPIGSRNLQVRPGLSMYMEGIGSKDRKGPSYAAIMRMVEQRGQAAEAAARDASRRPSESRERTASPLDRRLLGEAATEPPVYVAGFGGHCAQHQFATGTGLNTRRQSGLMSELLAREAAAFKEDREAARRFASSVMHERDQSAVRRAPSSQAAR